MSNRPDHFPRAVVIGTGPVVAEGGDSVVAGGVDPGSVDLSWLAKITSALVAARTGISEPGDQQPATITTMCEAFRQ